MRHEEVPHDRAEALGVRRDCVGVQRRDHDDRVGDPGGVPAVAADDAVDRGTDLAGELQRPHEVRRDVALGVAAADREHEHGVVGTETRHLEPARERRSPSPRRWCVP